MNMAIPVQRSCEAHTKLLSNIAIRKIKVLFSIVMTNPVLCARPIYYTTTKGEGAQHMLLKQQHRVHSLSVAASQLCCPKV